MNSNPFLCKTTAGRAQVSQPADKGSQFLMKICLKTENLRRERRQELLRSKRKAIRDAKVPSSSSEAQKKLALPTDKVPIFQEAVNYLFAISLYYQQDLLLQAPSSSDLDRADDEMSGIENQTRKPLTQNEAKALNKEAIRVLEHFIGLLDEASEFDLASTIEAIEFKTEVIEQAVSKAAEQIQVRPEFVEVGPDPKQSSSLLGLAILNMLTSGPSKTCHRAFGSSAVMEKIVTIVSRLGGECSFGPAAIFQMKQFLAFSDINIFDQLLLIKEDLVLCMATFIASDNKVHQRTILRADSTNQKMETVEAGGLDQTLLKNVFQLVFYKRPAVMEACFWFMNCCLSPSCEYSSQLMQLLTEENSSLREDCNRAIKTGMASPSKSIDLRLELTFLIKALLEAKSSACDQLAGFNDKLVGLLIPLSSLARPSEEGSAKFILKAPEDVEKVSSINRAVIRSIGAKILGQKPEVLEAFDQDYFQVELVTGSTCSQLFVAFCLGTLAVSTTDEGALSPPQQFAISKGWRKDLIWLLSLVFACPDDSVVAKFEEGSLLKIIEELLYVLEGRKTLPSGLTANYSYAERTEALVALFNLCENFDRRVLSKLFEVGPPGERLSASTFSMVHHFEDHSPYAAMVALGLTTACCLVVQEKSPTSLPSFLEKHGALEAWEKIAGSSLATHNLKVREMASSALEQFGSTPEEMTMEEGQNQAEASMGFNI